MRIFKHVVVTDLVLSIESAVALRECLDIQIKKHFLE